MSESDRAIVESESGAAAPASASEQPGWDRRDWFWLIVIVCLAFLLRAIYVLQLRQSPFFASETMDAGYHDMLAKRFAGGETMVEGVFFRAPLYPWFLGILHKISGTDSMHFIAYLKLSLTCNNDNNFIVIWLSMKFAPIT